MTKNNKAKRGEYKESTLVKRFFKHTDVPMDRCWNWTGRKNHGGYGQIGRKGKIEAAHRLAYLLFNGELPEALFVIHSCDNPSCVNPNHLRLGTQYDNEGDKKDRGRQNPVKGEDASWSKLSSEDVRNIREIRKKKQLSYAKIAEIWSIHPQTAYDICIKRTWKHIH